MLKDAKIVQQDSTQMKKVVFVIAAFSGSVLLLLCHVFASCR